MMFEMCDLLLIKNDHKSKIDNAIRYFSSGNFSHTACCLDDTYLFEMNCPKGAIARHISDYINENTTVMVAKPKFLTSVQKLMIVDYLRGLINIKVKYDYQGILGQLLRVPDKINSTDRMYCSEAVGLAYDKFAGYRFCGLAPEKQAPKDQGFDVISRQLIWELDYITQVEG